MKKVRFAIPIFVLSVGVVMSAAYGCTLNPFADISFEEAQTILSGASSSSAGGMGGAGGAPCMCEDDGNVCTNDLPGLCPNGDPAACHPVDSGAACPEGYCNPDGVCRDCLACEDALCVDRCNGVACAAGANCKSGYCQQSKCCNAPCAGPCRACDRTGTMGACTRMAVGLQVPGCTGTMICGNNGNCIAKTTEPLGALCDLSADCQSGLCRRGYCQSPIGEPCIEDLECGTSLCDPLTKTCQSCTGPGGVKCPSGSMCDAGTGFCKVPLGQPASTNAECLEGTVDQFLCSLSSGAVCEEHAECQSRNCVNGTCASFCMQSAECVAGTNCVQSTCRLLPGNYCVEDWLCQSGICSGFPRRCE